MSNLAARVARAAKKHGHDPIAIACAIQVDAIKVQAELRKLAAANDERDAAAGECGEAVAAPRSGEAAGAGEAVQGECSSAPPEIGTHIGDDERAAAVLCERYEIPEPGEAMKAKSVDRIETPRSECVAGAETGAECPPAAAGSRGPDQVANGDRANQETPGERVEAPQHILPPYVHRVLDVIRAAAVDGVCRLTNKEIGSRCQTTHGPVAKALFHLKKLGLITVSGGPHRAITLPGAQPPAPAPRARLSATDLRVLAVVTEAATAGVVCPSNEEIGQRLGDKSPATASNSLKRLEAASLIKVERFQRSRRVTIADGSQTAEPGNTTPNWRLAQTNELPAAGREDAAPAAEDAGNRILNRASLTTAGSGVTPAPGPSLQKMQSARPEVSAGTAPATPPQAAGTGTTRTGSNLPTSASGEKAGPAGPRPVQHAPAPKVFPDWRTCQFPLWGDDVRPTREFCGKPTQPGSSYCPDCHSRTHYRVTLKPRAATEPRSPTAPDRLSPAALQRVVAGG